jgi:hypothetical protein
MPAKLTALRHSHSLENRGTPRAPILRKLLFFLQVGQ